MDGVITRFAIRKLHGHLNIDVPIKDDLLVIVGENGSGKTTLINFIFLFLSGQWGKLTRFEFESIETTIGQVDFRVTRDEVRSLQAPTRGRQHVPIRYRQILDQHLPFLERRSNFNESELMVFSRQIGVPSIYVRRYLHPDATLFDDLRPTAVELRKNILSRIGARILYLPTYRRIEQDLKSLFPDATPEQISSIRRSSGEGERELPHIELVEFGMEDVSRILTRTINGIKEQVRTELYNLMLTYLSEVIQQSYSDVEVSKIAKTDPDTVHDIIKHIDESLLPASQKVILEETISRIRKMEAINENDKVLAHFFVKLLALQEQQEERERPLRDLIQICNTYLVGKQLVYDNAAFDITLRLTVRGDHSKRKIELRDLSSGEKQIVSLFTQLLLSKTKQYYILIDEPELSLSLRWQKRLLSDLSRRPECSGLIAATHSPFIFENEFEGYARGMNELLGVADELS